MATNWYIADDGSIHNKPATEKNTTSRVRAANTTAVNTSHRPVYRVSTGRKVCFWIVSIIMALLIGWLVNRFFGFYLFGDCDNFLATVGPYLIIVGAVGGSVLYGVFFARKVEYNLWAFVLSALCAVGGIITLVVGGFIVAFILSIAVYIFAIAIILGCICAAAGGGS